MNSVFYHNNILSFLLDCHSRSLSLFLHDDNVDDSNTNMTNYREWVWLKWYWFSVSLSLLFSDDGDIFAWEKKEKFSWLTRENAPTLLEIRARPRPGARERHTQRVSEKIKILRRGFPLAFFNLSRDINNQTFLCSVLSFICVSLAWKRESPPEQEREEKKETEGKKSMISYKQLYAHSCDAYNGRVIMWLECPGWSGKFDFMIKVQSIINLTWCSHFDR
jgi:hypothetical protein